MSASAAAASCNYDNCADSGLEYSPTGGAWQMSPVAGDEDMSRENVKDAGFFDGKVELMTNKQKQTVNSIYDSGNYTDIFERDITEARKRVIVSSPELTHNKIERFLYLLKPGQEAGVDVTVVTTEPENISYGNTEFCRGMIEEMRSKGIHVILKKEVAEHFAVMDDELVWHGGMNLLGKEDVWDNLMRIRSTQVAAELLEIVVEDREGE